MWNPVATRLQPFIKAMAHVDGIAAADVRPQRSPHCEQTAVIIGPLRGFACSACGAQSGHAPAIAFNHDLRNPAFGSPTCKNVTVIDFQRSMLLRREPAGRLVDGLTAVSGTA
jgi:hypothetical protein